MKWTTYAYLIFSIAAVTLCGFLANWQYQKAVDAQVVEANAIKVENSATVSELEWQSLGNSKLQKVSLNGHYCEPTLLLENRLYKGQNGYHVIQCFKTALQYYWVLKGWYPAPSVRDQLPELPTVTPKSTEILIQAVTVPNPANFDDTEKYSDENLDLTQQNTPSIFRLQYFDLKRVSPLLPNSAASAVKMITPPNNFMPIEDPKKVPKSYKHYGYAVQWLLIALATIFIAYRGVKYNESR